MKRREKKWRGRMKEGKGERDKGEKRNRNTERDEWKSITTKIK